MPWLEGGEGRWGQQFQSHGPSTPTFSSIQLGSCALLLLQSGWKDVVKGTGLYTGCMLTLSRDPSAAIQPAIALEFEHPSSTWSGAQQTQHGSGQQAQRAAAAAAEAGPQRAQQGAMVARDLSDGPLGKRNSAAIVNLREAGGVEAKRARPDGSSGPQAATMNTPVPPASLPAPPAWAAAPGLLPPAHEVPLDQFQMYRELKQAVAGCGVPGGWVVGGPGRLIMRCLGTLNGDGL